MATLVTSASSSTVSALSAAAANETDCAVAQFVVLKVSVVDVVEPPTVTAALSLVTVTVTLPVGGLSNTTV